MEEANIIAVVVGEDQPGVFFAAFKNQYDLKIKSETLHIGDWILTSVPKTLASQNTFPLQYEPTEFTVISPLYDTRVEENKVEISFPQYLTKEQKEMDNELLGTIKISNQVPIETGKYTVSIRPQTDPLEPIRKTKWIISNINHPTPPSYSLIGIICGSAKDGRKYVWSNRTKPGEDILIDACDLPNGTWVQLTWQSEAAFPNGRASHTVMSPIYPTSGSASTIGMTLVCEVVGSYEPKDLFHPFVGVILNRPRNASEEYKTLSTGTYQLEIVRTQVNVARDGVTQSVWNLNGVAAIGTHTFPTEPPPRPRRPHSSIRTRTNNPPPSVEAPPPYEPPLVGRVLHVDNAKTAVITGVQNSNTDVIRFYIWNFDELKSGILSIHPSQCGILGMGTFFTVTDFKQNIRNSTVVESHGENLRVVEKLYETRIEKKPNMEILNFKIRVEKCAKYQETMITQHEHFGTIVDNMNKLQSADSRMRLKLQIWIKRMNLNNLPTWVVVEAL